jgi:aquaporin Z
MSESSTSPTSMIKLFLAEMIGTAIFLSAIIVTIDTKKKGYFAGLDWLKIGLSLAVMIVIFGSISGSNLNPAVSLMLYLNDELSLEKLGVYVIAQLLGGVLAFVFFKFYQNELQDIPA